MTAYRGTVRGNVVVLPEGTDLPDGQEIEVWAMPPERGSIDRKQPEEFDPEEDFERCLVEIGVLSEVKRPSLDEPPGRISPVKLPGKPVSEIVIEERR